MILEAHGIRKSLGNARVLGGVDMTVERGERVVLLGENGSGKSTLLAILANVIEADQGMLRVSGDIGFAPEKPDIPEHLLAGEWLDLIASLKGLPRAPRDAFEVDQLLTKRASALSLGQRQRVSLAAAWLGDPPLLVLDEPTNGLDDAMQKELVTRLRERSAVIATHDPLFASSVATRLLTLRAGSLA